MSWSFNYDSPAAIKGVLDENGLVMSKKFGQNFLIDTHARARLAALAAPREGLRIWEIGPGLGSLTSSLLDGGASVTAFEIDHGFCRILRDQAFGDESRFVLIEGDFLKTWEAVLARNGVPDVLCSNLPYNVGSVCIARILESGCLPPLMVFTLQTEVAQRLAASSDSKDWSSLSMLVQADYDPEICFSLSGSCFYPPPNVSSSVIVLRRRESLLPEGLRPVFVKMIRMLFSKKRKTVKNNLSAMGDASVVLREAGIDPSLRPENLSINQVVSLCQAASKV
ncbi:MAG: 16S rRNA (adenine(1518)-N(6)/adenine(1519)-N(6))-dimethyltransferase RsmA [Sphaerochaetaceae bacterium]|jgi:16S rRNA (adenine1518-N6/adenine1519-N6)-dimethyltransferase|nr:16S rRNA (adenine(1518)-N(6)/adenine(1519)-N(6))-dimethyltransferase RsmA [Sphaerochaetaceae bacterium]MDD3163189.1 16S rRNA (adenine(1518)-N(6)/adenine(1519)-N(6))-dimethyltransferase RsmA [Sphaerochaetaceae bacterium]MDD4006547.1 16S rRNA (adenine(1518)-N(6)/adenine(1519)-N(6))-dimethyltransferase RsmA [Sphaerochaetaceae bacterium]MDD4397323.1 16S rRNA (adenine(1518)-N(6)/adenine(1519)-N(6))-dimethyltransferase RsmA [Sphaerochaetaceae bacterium]